MKAVRFQIFETDKVLVSHSGLATHSVVGRGHFHALRHFGALVLDNANVPIGVIQRILGHENRKTTEIALYSVGEGERKAINKFEEIFENHTQNCKKKGAIRIDFLTTSNFM